MIPLYQHRKLAGRNTPYIVWNHVQPAYTVLMDPRVLVLCIVPTGTLVWQLSVSRRIGLGLKMPWPSIRTTNHVIWIKLIGMR
jgi:hypothetical protein